MQATEEQTTLPVNSILQGDALSRLKELPNDSIDCVITSPPYWNLRDYKTEGQLGLEPTFTEYLEKLLAIFDEAKRVLKPTGTVWVNLGDTRAGNKQGNTNNAQKQGVNDMQINKKRTGPIKHGLLGIPARFAIGMQDHGWIWCEDIIWWKRNCMPSSRKRGFTRDFENIFMFAKSWEYYFETQYEPYAESTIKEFLTPYNGKATKDYEGNGVQNPSDLKRRIIHGPKIGGKKHANNNGNPTYSGKPWEISKVVEEYRIDTRPGTNTGNGKSGKKDDPNAGLHNSELSTKREQIVRVIDGQPYGRIKRCVWDITTRGFSGAHFATFPETLVEQMLKPGCPEWVCNKCGKPREPIWEPTEEYKKLLGKGWHDHKNDMEAGQMQEKELPSPDCQQYKIVAFSDCGCNAGFSGGICLDPFFGSGTTGLVALKHGRRFIGIELNPEYIEMAKKRLEPHLTQSRLI